MVKFTEQKFMEKLLYKSNLDQLIHKNTIPSSIFLYGNSNYFIDYYISKIKSLAPSDADIVSFYFDEYDFENIKITLGSGSLFSSSNIVIIKTSKNIPKKEIESLIQSTTKSGTNKLILAYYGDDKHTKSIQTPFVKSKDAEFVRFFAPAGNELYYTVQNMAKEINIIIDDYAIKTLISMQNSNLSFIESELKKLAIYEKPIDNKMVESLVYGLQISDVENIIVKILNKIPYEKDLVDILEKSSIDEMKFLSSIQNYVVMILTFHLYIKINGSLNVIKALGHPLPPQLVEERSNIAFRLNERVLQNILHILLQSEYNLKLKTNIDKKAILISTLIQLKSII